MLCCFLPTFLLSVVFLYSDNRTFSLGYRNNFCIAAVLGLAPLLLFQLRLSNWFILHVLRGSVIPALQMKCKRLLADLSQ